MDKIVYTPIGVVHSSFEKPQDVPIQSAAAKGVRGYIEVNKKYTDGLRDLDGFSHLIFDISFPFSQTLLFTGQTFFGYNTSRVVLYTCAFSP